LDRLTELLEAVGREPIATRIGDAAAAMGPPRPYVSTRLRPLTEHIEGRLHIVEWDAADALAARLLLDELTASLRTYRHVASDVSTRLHGVQDALKHGQRVLDREKSRTEADRLQLSPEASG